MFNNPTFFTDSEPEYEHFKKYLGRTVTYLGSDFAFHKRKAIITAIGRRDFSDPTFRISLKRGPDKLEFYSKLEDLDKILEFENLNELSIN